MTVPAYLARAALLRLGFNGMIESGDRRGRRQQGAHYVVIPNTALYREGRLMRLRWASPRGHALGAWRGLFAAFLPV